MRKNTFIYCMWFVSSLGPVCLANLTPHQPLRNVKWLMQMRDPPLGSVFPAL